MSDLVASATDDCDGNVLSNVKIVSANGDEPEDAPSGDDGATKNDIVIAANCQSIKLRAERNETAAAGCIA